jgi:hypothetical protein
MLRGSADSIGEIAPGHLGYRVRLIEWDVDGQTSY